MAEQQKSVKLGDIIQEFKLEILRTAPDYENVPLRALDINCPGLPLTGFFEHFDTKRLLLKPILMLRLMLKLMLLLLLVVSV